MGSMEAPFCHHVPTTKLTLFVVSEDEWDTKEGPGKSIKNVQKAYLGTKRHRTVKKIKPIALAVIELCLSEGVRQLVQSVENSINNFFFKIP